MIEVNFSLKVISVCLGIISIVSTVLLVYVNFLQKKEERKAMREKRAFIKK